MNGIIHITSQLLAKPYIPATVTRMAAGTELDVVEAPAVNSQSYSSPPQTYPGCYGLPYQDHNYGQPPPMSPKALTPIEIDPIIETPIESAATVTVETTHVAPGDDQVDDSVTRCICDFTHDDGYMICCDKCSVWQHIDCMGVDRDHIPDVYCCELCEPRIFDKQRAVALQTQRRQEITDGSSSEEEKVSSAYTAVTGRTPTSFMLRQKNKNSDKKRKRRDSAKSVDKNDKKQKKAKNNKLDKTVDVKNNKKTTKNGAKKAVSVAKVTRRLPPADCVEEDENAREAWDSSHHSWTDTYEEAKTNQYSGDIEAVLALNSLNGAIWAEPSLSKQLQVQLCKVAFVQNQKRGLLATCDVSNCQTIIEYRGYFMQRDQFDVENKFYKEDSPYVLFYNKCDNMDLCVDAAKYGNDARFVRRSCMPNAEVRHVVESGSISLYICSTKDIPLDTEVTIPFDFNYRDCDYCVDCACNRASCSVKKFFKKSKAKENDVPVKRKQRSKSAPDGRSTDDPAPTDTAGPVNCKKKKVMSPLKLSTTSTTVPSVTSPPLTVDTSVPTTLAPSKSPSGCGAPDPAVTSEISNDGMVAELDEKKLTREERKMLAIMRAFEKLEKRQERRKEALARLEHKKQDDEVGDSDKVKVEVKVEVKDERVEAVPPQPDAVDDASAEVAPPVVEVKKEPTAKKRKTKSNSTPARRRSRMNSGGSSTAYPSTDEEGCSHDRLDPQLSNPVTPTPTDPLNTPQSGKAFRFHKTKKHLMTEWLMEKSLETSKPLTIRTDMSEELADSAEFVKFIPSPHNSWTHLRRDSSQHPQVTVVRQASLNSSMGSAKKRWLRQAISETTTDSGNSSPVHNGTLSPSMPSPSCSPPPDFVTPLKKRRLARESLTSQDGLLTPSTPGCGTGADGVDILLKPDVGQTGDKNSLKPYSPVTPSLESDNLFEKFRISDRCLTDSKVLNSSTSVESDASDSVLSSSSCVKSETDTPSVPGVPAVTVTSCGQKGAPLETIEEMEVGSSSCAEGDQEISEEGVLPGVETKSEPQSTVEHATDTERSISASEVQSTGKASRLDDLSEGEIVSSDEEDEGQCTSSTGVACSSAVAKEAGEHACREAEVSTTTGTLESKSEEVDSASRHGCSNDAPAVSSVLSTIPFGPAGYVSLSDKLASLVPERDQTVSSCSSDSTDHVNQLAVVSKSQSLEFGSPGTPLLSPTSSLSSGHLTSSSSETRLTINVPVATSSPNTSCPPTPTVPGTPPVKKKVSLSEYRKRLKDKSSSSSSPVKMTTPPAYGIVSPMVATAPTLPSLPLFSRVSTSGSKDQDRDLQRTESDANAWPPSRENKPISLMERLRKEFGVDADEDETDSGAPVDTPSVETTAYQTNMAVPPPPSSKIPSLLSLPTFTPPPFQYKGVPQPVPPPPPQTVLPPQQRSTYSSQPANQYSTVVDTSKIPSLLNGNYSAPAGLTPPSSSRLNGPGLSNGPPPSSHPPRHHYNKQQYYKR